MFKKILVAVDQSTVSAQPVDVAVQLAAQLGARIAVVHVVDDALAFVPDLVIADPALMTRLRRDGAAAVEAACGRIPPELPLERILVEGEPSEMIIATAREWRADLIVLGNDSRGRLAHFLLGSTADSVIRRASCPVVAVRCDGSANHERPAAARAVAGAGA